MKAPEGMCGFGGFVVVVRCLGGAEHTHDTHTCIYMGDPPIKVYNMQRIWTIHYVYPGLHVVKGL